MAIQVIKNDGTKTSGQRISGLRVSASTTIYVDNLYGNDTTGNGTPERPYRTLPVAWTNGKTNHSLFSVSNPAYRVNATTGTAGGGRFGSKFQTIQQALAHGSFVANDIVYVEAGTHTVTGTIGIDNKDVFCEEGVNIVVNYPGGAAWGAGTFVFAGFANITSINTGYYFLYGGGTCRFQCRSMIRTTGQSMAASPFVYWGTQGTSLSELHVIDKIEDTTNTAGTILNISDGSNSVTRKIVIGSINIVTNTANSISYGGTLTAKLDVYIGNITMYGAGSTYATNFFNVTAGYASTIKLRCKAVQLDRIYGLISARSNTAGNLDIAIDSIVSTNCAGGFGMIDYRSSTLGRHKINVGTIWTDGGCGLYNVDGSSTYGADIEVNSVTAPSVAAQLAGNDTFIANAIVANGQGSGALQFPADGGRWTGTLTAKGVNPIIRSPYFTLLSNGGANGTYGTISGFTLVGGSATYPMFNSMGSKTITLNNCNVYMPNSCVGLFGNSVGGTVVWTGSNVMSHALPVGNTETNPGNRTIDTNLKQQTVFRTLGNINRYGWFKDEQMGYNTQLIGGTTQTSTNQKFADYDTIKFNGGATDAVRLYSQFDYDFASYDWTIEFWFSPNASSGGTALYGKSTGANHGINLGITGAGAGTGISIYIGNGSAWTISNLSAPYGSSFTAGTWYHFALCRSGNNLYAFINGVACTGYPNASMNFAISAGTTPHQFGANASFTAPNVQMCDMRITRELGRYTTGFTPNTSPLTGY